MKSKDYCSINTDVTIGCDFVMMAVLNKMCLSDIEKVIAVDLSSCDLWADLKLSEDDFSILTEKLKTSLSEVNKAKAFIKLMKDYPLSCVTQMVFYMVYNYQDEFWIPWADSLGIKLDQGQSSAIGQMVKKILTLNNYSYNEDGYKYITPLICQAGIPKTYFYELFDVVDAEDQQVIDPFSLINELLGWKSYQIHKPVYRFINSYREKAVTLLVDVNEMIHSSAESLSQDSYDVRLVSAYDRWRSEQTINKWKKRKEQQDFPFPSVTFSDDGRGFCLRIPSVISKNEYASYVKWKITPCDEGAVDIEVTHKYFHDADKLYTKECLVSIAPSAYYKVVLYDDINGDTPLKEQTVLGIGNDDYIIFDSHGRRIADGYLPADNGYIIANREKVRVEFVDTNHIQLNLPKKSNNFSAWCVAPESISSKVNINCSKYLRILNVRTQISASLVDAPYFFGEEPLNNSLPIYTAFPSLSLSGLPYDHTYDFMITIRNRLNGIKKTESVKDLIDISGYIKLSRMIPDISSSYGIYDIRIYEKSSFRKGLAFASIPHIEYSNYLLNPWPTKYSNVGLTGFSYASRDDVKIDVNGDIIQSPREINGIIWVDISIASPTSVVSGTLCFNANGTFVNVTWHKRVRFLEWRLWNESQIDCISCFETQIIEDINYEISNYWLSLWMNTAAIDDTPVLNLVNKNGFVLQKVDVKFSSSEKWTIALDAFATTIEGNRLPADLVLSFSESGNTRIVILAHLIETILLPGLTYRNDDGTKGRPALLWKSERPLPESPAIIKGISEPDYERIISFDKTVKTKNQLHYGLFLNDVPPAGIYKIEPIIEDDFFIEDVGYKPPIMQGQNIFPVDAIELYGKFGKLSDLLKILIVYSDKLKVLESVEQYYHKNKTKIVSDVSEVTCKHFICLICNFADQDDERSSLIMSLTDRLNIDLVTDSQRIQFAKWILNYSLSTEQLKNCFRWLNLFLAIPNNTTELTIDEIKKIGDMNPELELIWMLRLRKTQGLSQKIISIAGLDAIKNMVSFVPHAGCKEPDWHTCFEKTITGRCKCVQTTITLGVFGCSEDFRNMFNWGEGYKLPRLDLTKRPENGVYFCGQTYVDLLITWYLSNLKNGKNPSDLVVTVQSLYSSLDMLKVILQQADWSLANEYFKKISGRDIGTKVGFYPPLYYTAVAALSSSFCAHGKITEEQYTSGKRFLAEMMNIFPEIVKRDLLLCELNVLFNGGN